MSAIDIKDYFNHETRICLLERSIVNIDETMRDLRGYMREIQCDMKELSHKIDSVETKLESKIDRLYWAILGIYGTGFLTLFGYFVKSHNWF